MSGQPLVSVVTPTLNRAALLEGTLESVAAQTYPAVEHIVVDGGSADGTRALLERWEETSGLRWRSEPDDGMYSAVNKGLGLARGEILAYLNSDDRYFPWTIATAVDALDRAPDAWFVFGDALAFDLVSGRIQLRLIPPLSLRYLARHGFLSQPSVFWRRSAMERVGMFDESLRFVADCDYWMRLAAQGAGVKVNEVLALELDHEATHRQRSAQEVWRELAAVRSRHAPSRSALDEVAWWRAAGLRRWYLLSLALTVSSSGRGGGWRNFVRAVPRRSLSVRWMLAGLLPFSLRRVDRRIIGNVPDRLTYRAPSVPNRDRRPGTV
jgi:GT2 family glycosyltransferase